MTATADPAEPNDASPAARTDRVGPCDLSDNFERTLDVIEGKFQPVRLPTGFHGLDQILQGLRNGTLTVIASRPAIGRSTLLLDICRSVAVQNEVPTLHVSLEHGTDDTTMRLISAECRIALHHLRGGRLTDEGMDRMARRMPLLSSAPLYMWSPPRLTAAGLAHRAREMAEELDVRFIALDGIQDVRPEKRNDLREREVGDVVRDLKTLARELDIPIVATSHLNRAPEQRLDHMPALDDLRESGAITFAADTIILLHRPDAYVPAHERAGEADLIVAKSRDGVPATTVVAFQGHYGRFVEMAVV